MPSDFGAYLAARELVSRVGPWLLWPAVAAAWGGVLLSLARRPESPSGFLPRPAWATGLSFGLLASCFGLLAWYHLRIHQLLPLSLPADAGNWVNAQLRAMAGGGRPGLPPIDWADPPRFAIPLWIEGEKLFFWTLVMGLVVLLEERRGHRGYLFVLRLMLALQATGMVLWDNPAVEPLPKFHEEVARWFGTNLLGQVQYFFQLYPRMTFYYNASYMWTHPPMLFIGYATLAATFAASLFAFRDPDPRLDRAGYAYAKVGYLLLTVGMLVGYPWAIVAWGPNWWWDPKIASSLMMWLLYSAYLHHRFLIPYRGGRVQTAALGVLCYASLLFTYFMSWYFPGEHTF